VSRRQSAILVQTDPGLGEDLGGERGAALRLSFEEMEALGLGILKNADHVVAAHCHVAMVFPAQALDRCAIATAMGIDPFRGVDLAEIAGPDRLCRRELALDQGGGGRLAETGERARHLFLRRIVPRHDGCRRLDPVAKPAAWPVITLRKWFPTGSSTERHQSLNCATLFLPVSEERDRGRERRVSRSRRPGGACVRGPDIPAAEVFSEFAVLEQIIDESREVGCPTRRRLSDLPTPPSNDQSEPESRGSMGSAKGWNRRTCDSRRS
jgi:hypothetical protein